VRATLLGLVLVVALLVAVADDAAASCTAVPGRPTVATECDDTIEVDAGNDVLPTVGVLAAGVLVAGGLGWAWWTSRSAGGSAGVR
jgi:hypothetical protein